MNISILHHTENSILRLTSKHSALKSTFCINIVTYLTMERKLMFICVKRCWCYRCTLTNTQSLCTFQHSPIFVIRSLRFQSKSGSFHSKTGGGIFSSSAKEAARTGRKRVKRVKHMYLDRLFPDVDELEHNKSIEKLVVMAATVAMALLHWQKGLFSLSATCLVGSCNSFARPAVFSFTLPFEKKAQTNNSADIISEEKEDLTKNCWLLEKLKKKK